MALSVGPMSGGETKGADRIDAAPTQYKHKEKTLDPGSSPG